MANWWKCKIVKPSMMIPYSNGEIIFAQNGAESITLYDGRRVSQVSKAVLRYLMLVSRLHNPDSDLVQRDYEQKRDTQAIRGSKGVQG